MGSGWWLVSLPFASGGRHFTHPQASHAGRCAKAHLLRGSRSGDGEEESNDHPDHPDHITDPIEEVQNSKRFEDLKTTWKLQMKLAVVFRVPELPE